jgi:Ca2+/Na+ antiporter
LHKSIKIYNRIYYKPLPPPGLLPLKNQESVRSNTFILLRACLVLLFILFLNLLKVFLDTSLYFFNLIKIDLFSLANKDEDLTEHEHEEHEHEELLEFVVFPVLSKVISSLVLCG